MRLINDKNKLERLDQLIRLKATGSPEELAAKFNTTKRTIFRTINELKEIGVPIYFSQIDNSYCYAIKGKLIIGFEEIEKQELNSIKGGVKNFFMSDIFCHPKNIKLYCEINFVS